QAQQWQLVAPIRDDDRMGDMKMIDPVTGFMIDDQHGGIFSTRDGGAHWDRKANNFGAVGMPRALWMWDAQRGVIAANGGRIYRTNDGFDSFLPTVTITGVTIGNCTAIHFVNDTLGFVGTSTGKIFRTEDAGLTWPCRTAASPPNSDVSSSWMIHSRFRGGRAVHPAQYRWWKHMRPLPHRTGEHQGPPFLGCPERDRCGLGGRDPSHRGWWRYLVHYHLPDHVYHE
ncbi:MAG: hypothetical protein IPN62_16340, partial [Flavobacteriales bacterium]|nr:hypothetical protein [Flavobacteriales bacterium]